MRDFFARPRVISAVDKLNMLDGTGTESSWEFVEDSRFRPSDRSFLSPTVIAMIYIMSMISIQIDNSRSKNATAAETLTE